MGLFTRLPNPIFKEQEELLQQFTPKVLAFFKEEKIINIDEALGLFIYEFSQTYVKTKGVITPSEWALLIAKYVVYMIQVEEGKDSEAAESMKTMLSWVEDLCTGLEEIPAIFYYFQIAKKENRAVWEIYLDEVKKFFKEVRGGK